MWILSSSIIFQNQVSSQIYHSKNKLHKKAKPNFAGSKYDNMPEDFARELIEKGATLSSFLKDNDAYEKLVASFYNRLKVIEQFSNEATFIEEEIERIQSLYLKPLKVAVQMGIMRNEMNFTIYVGYAYRWLQMGQDWSIEQIIISAKSGRDENTIIEPEFSNAIVHHLKEGVAYLMYEKFLKTRLKTLGTNNKIHSSSIDSTQHKILLMENKNETVFVSYAWDSVEHEEKVLSFTNFLRDKGFNAEMDKMLSQEETAIDFMKMMHQKMVNSSKVIIILSKGYKEKAENFKGGVGEEYALIIKDIKEQPTKYILVSFEGISNSVVPLGLAGREIVDMQKQGAADILFAKLLNHKYYEFSEVAKEKPVLSKKSIAEFETMSSSSGLEIGEIQAKSDNASLLYNLYKYAEDICRIEIKNNGSKVISEYVVEIHIPKDLIPDYHNHTIKGENVVLKFDQGKLYPGQEGLTPEFTLRVSNRNIDKVIDSLISISVFSDLGIVKKEIPLKSFFTLNGNYPNITELRRDLFLDPNNG